MNGSSVILFALIRGRNFYVSASFKRRPTNPVKLKLPPSAISLPQSDPSPNPARGVVDYQRLLDSQRIQSARSLVVVVDSRFVDRLDLDPSFQWRPGSA